MESPFVKVKTYQGYVLVSQELLSPCSQDATQLHRHESPVDVEPQSIQHGNASQLPFAVLGTPWPGPCSGDFSPALNLEYSQADSQLLASHSSTQRLDCLEGPASQYSVSDLAAEYSSYGHPMCAAQSQLLCASYTELYTGSLGNEHISIPQDAELNVPVIEAPKNYGSLPVAWVEKDSPYWDRAKYELVRPADSRVETHVLMDDVRVQYNAPLFERNDVGIPVKRRSVPKPHQRSSAGYLRREETDAIKSGTGKCDITEATAQTTAEYISRRQTTYTNVNNLSMDKKGQERMGRIRENLVNLEHQTMAHAKRQLDAVEDSFHDF